MGAATADAATVPDVEFLDDAADAPDGEEERSGAPGDGRAPTDDECERRADVALPAKSAAAKASMATTRTVTRRYSVVSRWRCASICSRLESGPETA
ncbi:hypothetical protein [Halospeciosus flavus]|uniref:hypothetical protein n=1 Tax=Halospeciosus flavus TaxID=3032283 RepID=UPI0036181F41